MDRELAREREGHVGGRAEWERQAAGTRRHEGRRRGRRRDLPSVPDPIDPRAQPAIDAGELFLRRRVVSEVGTLDTLIGVALLFGAVAIALRLAQNAILGRDRR